VITWRSTRKTMMTRSIIKYEFVALEMADSEAE